MCPNIYWCWDSDMIRVIVSRVSADRMLALLSLLSVSSIETQLLSSTKKKKIIIIFFLFLLRFLF